jgi:8-oxo-dGTP diphosphatase
MIHVLSRAIIIKNDCLLMVFDPRMSIPVYNLPGGHVELQEPAASALIRELNEEIGPGEYRIEKYLGCLEHLFDPKDPRTCHSHEYGFYFLVDASCIDADTLPMQREVHVKLEWIPLEKLSNLNVLTPSFPKALNQWMSLIQTHA